MIPPISVVGFFCEDIREEKTGQDTIVGTLADNFAVPGTPGLIGKLGLFVRLHMDASIKAKTLALRIKMPDGKEMPMGPPDDKIISATLNDARLRNFPIAAVVLRLVLSPFQVTGYGLMTAIVTIDGVDYIAAYLNIVAANQPASVSAPPASQSPPAS